MHSRLCSEAESEACMVGSIQNPFRSALSFQHWSSHLWLIFMLVRQLMQIASEQVELWIIAHTHGRQHQVSSLSCSWVHRAAMHQTFIMKVCWLFSVMFKPLSMLDLQLQKNEKTHHPCREPSYFWKQVVSLSIWFKFERTAPCPKAVILSLLCQPEYMMTDFSIKLKGNFSERSPGFHPSEMPWCLLSSHSSFTAEVLCSKCRTAI